MRPKRKIPITVPKRTGPIPKRKFPSITPQLDRDKCVYLADEKLPVLVLALDREYKTRPEYRTLPGRKWLHVVHQTAGHSCHQHYMLGTILRPRKKVLAGMKHIDDFWLDTDSGSCGSPTLDEVNTYRIQLRSLLGVDCQRSYQQMEEGFYPIDLDTDTLEKLTSERFPKELDRLLVRPAPLPMVWWNIYILGNNCD